MANSITLQEWILQKPYWETFLWKICAEKENIVQADIDLIYEQLLIDAKLLDEKPRVTIDNITSVNGDDLNNLPKILLKQIHSFDNVNALPKETVINFSENLTIIYGENGSGKSGISRLFGNACFFRGKKDLLPNVKLSNSSLPNANFILAADADTKIEYNYKLGDTLPELKRFYVFDTSSSINQLDYTNNVNFTPSKLNIFNKVKEVVTQIETIIQNQHTLRKKDNPVNGVFINESGNLATSLKNITANTTDEQLESYINFNNIDELRVLELEKLISDKLKVDIPKRKAHLKAEIVNLTSLGDILNKLIKNISSEKKTGLNNLIKLTNEKKVLSAKISSESFVNDDFKSIGNERWINLITVARELYDFEEKKLDNNTLNSCILCQQALSDDSKLLFNNYWNFLKSNAKLEFEEAQKKIQTSIDWMNTQIQNFPTFETTNIAVNILNVEQPEYLLSLKSGFDSIKIVLENWLQSLIKLEESTIDIPEISLQKIIDLITAKTKEEIELKDPTQEVKKLNTELTELKNKRTATGLKTQLVEYKAFLVWQSKIGKVSISAVKRNLTTKRTEYFNEEVAKQYAENFTDECKNLNADFGLQIYTKGEAQDSVKGLQLSFAKNHSPSKILSEGEQKVCSIADFLTEVNLDVNSTGIVLDDPVTSLDHARKELIAKRLVNEANKRQVIIFTHDIVFLLALQHYAKELEMIPQIQTIRRIGNDPGFTTPNSPWIASSVSVRCGKLKNDLQRITKLHKTADPEDYRNEIKAWCELLREAWERSIEEILFKGVISRFSPSVETQKLKDVEISAEQKKMVKDGMTETSKWIHDQAAALNSPTPTPDIAKAWIESFESFISAKK